MKNTRKNFSVEKNKSKIIVLVFLFDFVAISKGLCLSHPLTLSFSSLCFFSILHPFVFLSFCLSIDQFYGLSLWGSLSNFSLSSAFSKHQTYLLFHYFPFSAGISLTKSYWLFFSIYNWSFRAFPLILQAFHTILFLELQFPLLNHIAGFFLSFSLFEPFSPDSPNLSRHSLFLESLLLYFYLSFLL